MPMMKIICRSGKESGYSLKISSGVMSTEQPNQPIASGSSTSQREGSHQWKLIYGSAEDPGLPDLTEDEKRKTLFVKNLAHSVTEDQLRDHFSCATKVILPLRGEKNRGYAYVMFADVKKCAEGMKMKQSILNGKHLKIKPATVKKLIKRKEIKTNTLMIKKLQQATTEKQLQELFEHAKHVNIISRQNCPLNHAFIEFETVEDAEDALNAMDGEVIDGQEIELNFWKPFRRDGKYGQGGNKRHNKGGRGQFHGKKGRKYI
ncbi:hypothetical protein ScPMuIL_003918 [Solemya velum]